MTTEKISDFIKRYILTIILCITTIAYLFLDFFQLNVTEEFDWLKLTGAFIINFGFGYAITTMLSNAGIRSGQESQKYKDTLQAYSDAKVKTDSYNELAEVFCENYNIRNKETILNEFFRDCGVNRKRYEDGYYKTKEHRKELTLKQRIALRNIHTRTKVVPVTPKYLYSLSSASYRTPKVTKDIAQHTRDKAITKFFTKAMFSICFTILAFELVVNPNWSNFVSSLIKVATWLVLGGVSYFQEYQYVTQQYLQNVVVDKTDLLVQFDNEYKSGKFAKVDANHESSLL